MYILTVSKALQSRLIAYLSARACKRTYKPVLKRYQSFTYCAGPQRVLEPVGRYMHKTLLNKLFFCVPR